MLNDLDLVAGIGYTLHALFYLAHRMPFWERKRGREEVCRRGRDVERAMLSLHSDRRPDERLSGLGEKDKRLEEGGGGGRQSWIDSSRRYTV